MATLSLTVLALCVSPAALALDSGDIVVASVKGEVHVTMSGTERPVRAGSLLEPPAAIRTGRDGAIELRQGATSLSVGPETLLEFPALEKRGAPVDRIVQPRGNAFYNVGKRDGRKLRVETPYLVGVVKGTQFNVAAQDETTTISLFEGLLEVRATDDSDVVDLRAGEIASRNRGDKTISVMKMDGKTPTTAPRPSQGNDNNGNGAPGGNAPRPAPRGNEGSLNAGASIVGDDVVAATVAPSVSADVKDGANLTTGLDVRANGITANVGTAVDVGADTANVGVTAGANLAAVSVDAGASVAVGAGTVDAGTTVAVDTPVVAVDAAADVSTDLGASGASVAAAVDTGASVAGVDAGVAAATDVTAGTVDVGVAVAGLDVNLGVDLGLDAADTTPDLGTTTTTVTDTTTTTVLDVGGLLDSLVRRPGRK